MNGKAWIERIATAAFLLGSVLVAAGWIYFLTARCEGFGCIGQALGLVMTVAAEAVTAAVGAFLLRLKSRHGGAPRWLWTMEVILVVPVVVVLAGAALKALLLRPGY